MFHNRRHLILNPSSLTLSGVSGTGLGVGRSNFNSLLYGLLGGGAIISIVTAGLTSMVQKRSDKIDKDKNLNQNNEEEQEEIIHYNRWLTDNIKTYIEKLGFPIVMCLLLVYIIFVSLANNTTAINNLVTYLSEHHVSIIDK